MIESGKEATGPLFVAGVPRSGTHVLAHLVGRHSRYFTIPREVRFHTKGVVDYLRGEVSGDELITKLEQHWWKRPASWDRDHAVGLFKTIPRECFEAGIEAFAALQATDRLDAARTLVRSMFDPLAARAGKQSWVEHTPRNGVVAPELLLMFPNAKFVHMVRDPRDRACSVLALPIHESSVSAAFQMWEVRLYEIDACLQRLPADRHRFFHLEDLALFDRERSYGQLLDFLELEDEEEMREFFDTEVTPDRAHIGRWHTELPADELPVVESLYDETLARLRAKGVSCLPPERHAMATYPAQKSEPPNPYDPWADGVGADVL